MTLRPHHDEPCWEIHSKDTQMPPEADSGDGWPHFRTCEGAEAGILARCEPGLGGGGKPGDYYPALAFDGLCLGCFCDEPGCTAEVDMTGEGATHLDPADPLPIDIENMDWWASEDNTRHFCDKHTPGWCEACGDRHENPQSEADEVCAFMTATGS